MKKKSTFLSYETANIDKIWEQGRFLYMKVVEKTLYNLDLYEAVNKRLWEKERSVERLTG